MLGALVTSPTIDLGSGSKSKARTTSHRPWPSTSMPPDPTATPVARTAVSLEYASLRHKEHCPLGMYVVPSVENLLVWDAVFFVHQGA